MLELVYSDRTDMERDDRNRRPSWAEASDRDLLLSVRDGNEAALNELIGRKTKPLLQLAGRILGDAEEARDVVQVTFFKVWENRGRFDDRFSPNTWIYRIASNLAIDHLRSRKSRERSAEPVRQHLRQVADSRAHRDLSRLQQGEVAAIFRELSSDLSEKQRLVFLLREVEGLSSQEVAEIVGCRESTVRNHLFNARKLLRRELIKRYPEYAAGWSASLTPEEALAHFDRCPACRSAAVTADPTLLFRRLPELPLDAAAEQAEVAAMRQAVTAMRTARRLGPAGERRVLSHAWRWAAAAALAVLSLSLGTARDLRDLKGPQVASHLGAPAAKAEQPLLPAAVPAAVRLNSGEVPVVEELNRPAARVYQMNGGENLSVVMIVDERLDV